MRKLLLFIIIGFIGISGLRSQERHRNVMVVTIVTDKDSLVISKKVTESMVAIDQIHRKLDDKVIKLRDKGFLEANIDSLVKRNDSLFVYLHVGGRYKWDNVILRDELAFSLQKIGSRGNVTWKRVDDLAGDVIAKYENAGYPFAQLNVTDLQIENRKVEGVWELEQKNFIIWDSIELKGALDINEKFLSNYLDVKYGKQYKEKTAKKIVNRINNLSFARSIKPSEIEFSKSKAKVYVYLDKEVTNQFDGIIGFQRSKDEKLVLTGEVNLKLNNVFSAGEQIGLNWKKTESESQKLNLSFAYPYVLKSDLGFDFAFGLQKQDSTYLTTDLNFGIRMFQSSGNYLKLIFKRQSTSLIASEYLKTLSVLPEVADTKVNFVGVGGHINTLDYTFNPTKGLRLDMNAGVGIHEIRKNGNLVEGLYDGMDLKGNLLNSVWDIEYNKPVISRISWRFKIKGGVVDAPNLFENDKLKFGGLKTLRGFNEDQFRANFYNVLSNEIRFIPGKNTSLFLFFDGAYYKNQMRNTSTSDYPWAVGFGVNFATKGGIFTLNYALGKQNNQDMDFQSAKIHFGFVSRF